MAGGIVASRGRGSVGLPGGLAVDAFGRQRISQPSLIFDSQMEYDAQDIFWDTVLENGGSVTHRQSDSALRMAVTTTKGSRVVRQTKEYFPYRPGKSHLLNMTFALGQHVSGVRCRVGLFDDNDGVFFERGHDGTLAFVVRKGGTDNRSRQTSWNKDRFDGDGPSGIKIDAAKAQILLMDLQWLGVGRVRFGWDINDRSYEANEFRHANRVTTSYMRSANLPVRYEIEQVGGSSAAAMQQICCALASEGGETKYGLPFSASNKGTVRAIDDPLPVISIRPKLLLNGRVNRSFIIPRFIHSFADSSAFWTLLYDADLTNASWASVHADSSMEYDVSATAYSGGIELANGYVPSSGRGRRTSAVNDSLLGQVPLVVNYAGDDSTPLTLVMGVLTGSGNGGGAFDWREIR